MKKSEKLAYEAALEACPFCGSTDVELDVLAGLHQERVYWASCRNCRASTRPNSQASTAVALWNQRAESAPEPAAEKRKNSNAVPAQAGL
jgi:Lar family restriction alleviation protein